MRPVLITIVVCLSLARVLAQGDSEEKPDSSNSLPPEYAENFLIAATTLSPDGKLGIIYPKIEAEGEKNYLVILQPFKILTALDTKDPHFQNKNHGGVSAAWSNDSSVALVTLDGRWGPGDIFLYELRDGSLIRSTNLLGKIHDLLAPDFTKSKSPRYNDNFDFVFDGPTCELDDIKAVRVDASATTDPKGIPGEHAWDGELKAVWDIPQAKFSSQKVTRLFAGVRKDSGE